ncbi:MAG: hypothetical protein AAGA33_11280 [Pseudomonadota bacterium]
MQRFSAACVWLVVLLLSSSSSLSCDSEAADVDIYPTANVLPDNLLRFYVYFPRQMSGQVGASDLMLLDADGEPVTNALLATTYELWSPDRRRLTVLLDPGRVKTGLYANDTLGRPLINGRRYTIQVPGDLSDSAGCLLGTTTTHSFTAGPTDKATPAPSTWQLKVPRAGSKDALQVDLGSPHDHLSMAYRIRVIDHNGALVAGRISLSDNEHVWQFMPRDDWSHSSYRISVDPRLEDLAGNRPGVRFDRDINVPEQKWDREIVFLPGSDANE